METRTEPGTSRRKAEHWLGFMVSFSCWTMHPSQWPLIYPSQLNWYSNVVWRRQGSEISGNRSVVERRQEGEGEEDRQMSHSPPNSCQGVDIPDWYRRISHGRVGAWRMAVWLKNVPDGLTIQSALLEPVTKTLFHMELCPSVTSTYVASNLDFFFRNFPVGGPKYTSGCYSEAKSTKIQHTAYVVVCKTIFMV